jgi:hypothetical protein
MRSLRAMANCFQHASKMPIVSTDTGTVRKEQSETISQALPALNRNSAT